MADKDTSGITDAGALDGTERVYIVKGGNSRDTTAQAIGDLGGGGDWEVVDTHDFGASPVIDFVVTGIDAYQELLVIVKDMVATNPVRLFLSTDGGSTWLNTNGDYKHWGLDENGANVVGDDDNGFQFNGAAVGTAANGIMKLRGMASASMFTSYEGYSAAEAPSHFIQSGFAAVIAVHDAMRVYHVNDTNITGGVVHVYGK